MLITNHTHTNRIHFCACVTGLYNTFFKMIIDVHLLMGTAFQLMLIFDMTQIRPVDLRVLRAKHDLEPERANRLWDFLSDQFDHRTVCIMSYILFSWLYHFISYVFSIMIVSYHFICVLYHYCILSFHMYFLSPLHIMRCIFYYWNFLFYMFVINNVRYPVFVISNVISYVIVNIIVSFPICFPSLLCHIICDYCVR